MIKFANNNYYARNSSSIMEKCKLQIHQIDATNIYHVCSNEVGVVHRCRNCKQFVHLICEHPLDLEGYGQDNLVPRLLSTLPVPSRCERTLLLSGQVIGARLPYEVGVGRLSYFVTAINIHRMRFLMRSGFRSNISKCLCLCQVWTMLFTKVCI